MDWLQKKQSDLMFIGTRVLGILTILFLGGFAAPQDRDAAGEITVFAAAGTMSAVQPIADAYRRQTGCNVVVNFSASSTLARQIAAGADFDVYISANPQWMDDVQEKGLIDNRSRRDLLSDKLVLIAPVDAKLEAGGKTIPEILLSSKTKIAIGDTAHVPCGMYARQALVNLHCWDAISCRTVPAASVRAAQQYVETGECELGIVYRAGAAQSDTIKILATFDESLHPPIRFSAASAVTSETGGRFLTFLTEATAVEIFRRAGFTICPRNASIGDDAPATHPAAPVPMTHEWQAFMISIKVAATCTLVVAAPGVWLGYILARKSFPGRALVNACVHLPMVIPPVVTGYLALILLGKNSPVGHWLEETFGLSLAFSWAGAVLVSAVMGFPLLVRSVKTAVEMIDRRYLLTANTLGAGPVRAFFTITLPLAGPGILAGLILAFTRSLGEFGATATFAGNIPGKTQTLSLAIYNFTQIPGAESAALRLVVLSVALSLVAMLLSECLAHRMKHLSGTAA